MSNVKTIQELYAAFGRGDIPAILSRLAESVEWDYNMVPSTAVRWLKPRRGREETAEFFTSLGEIESHKLAPKEFLEGRGVVVVILDIEFTARATGVQVAEEDALHVWRFDPEGRVTRFRHGVDTHRHHLAWGGPAEG
jgi:ketosteroid isomerase-like protein